MEEEWKDVVGYEDCYEISNHGNVRSKERKTHTYGSRHRTFPSKQLIGYVNKKGYVIADLCKEGNRKSHSVHRLVAMAWLENPHERTQVDHIDRNPSNNMVSNLRWVTGAENQANRGKPVHNTSGELHIRQTFKFQVTRNGKVIQKTFNTLDEAKAYRLEVLGF